MQDGPIETVESRLTFRSAVFRNFDSPERDSEKGKDKGSMDGSYDGEGDGGAGGDGGRVASQGPGDETMGRRTKNKKKRDLEEFFCFDFNEQS